jgi:hypothetical protein
MPTTTRKRPSLGELADRFEAALTEKKDLESRLSKTLGEVAGERSRLNSEIAALRAQLEQQKKSQSGAEGATVSTAAKERLIKDELERKFQAVIVEARREQKRYAEQLAQLKIRLSQCICQSSSGGHDWA